ncbi:nucleoid-associated protein [Flavobacterium sp.]|uniref:nucleoid-associated protein n=1 Tax=Flavobacterium sp. TaxID=239 RepID=UPI0011F5EB80|nr:nucleoid-associated protein [Flavobacterium sp.]RZJ71537.1 MAG: hypothetical protein EOO49_09260 [Flavobacterium sp.]
MNLQKIIVHELQKTSGREATEVIASTELLTIDDDSNELISSLLGSYSSDKLLNAQFDRSPGKYFPVRFDDYIVGSRTAQDFIDFTTDAIGNLAQIIRRKIAAKGGYVLFCEYTSNGTPFVGIFLIRDVEGKILRREGTSYTIGRIEYLDTSHLAMACRINERLLNSEQNYLTFTQLRQQEVSDYFTDWICVLQLQSSSEFTKALYDIISNLPLPIDDETNQPYSVDEVRDMVFEIARGNPRKEISISTVGEQVYGNRHIIREYADLNNISIDSEFRYDKRALRKFIQLSINKDGINLKFSRGDLGTKVFASEDNPNQVIIESERLAAALRAEE